MSFRPHHSKPPVLHPAAADRAEMLAREYQDFVYIVSHDFSAPLRHIKQFTKLIVDANKDHLGEEEQHYVEFLEKSLQKLEKMQEALLAISRLNTQDKTLAPVDCNETVKKILIDMKDAINKAQISMVCKTLPTINANPRQMQMLFSHLISNAIKFHDAARDNKEASISAADRGDSWLFKIGDNGIGIPPDNQADVFRLFRQLEPDRYPGLGAGLTIARKIVQRHKGEIVLESMPHKGTNVLFSIPKNLEWP